jgi:protein-L-isoaspartate(D-aspartate) O-methyltransferase
MDREQELGVIRRTYAKLLMASVGLNDERVETAFATVERERYLGPGPWQIWRHWGYAPTPNADPVYLYADVLIGIVPERGLNNGMPSYHAPLIARAALQEGDYVVHIGAGTGYYTAIMAHLVGLSGKVMAIECDPRLAARATDNFASSNNVGIVEGDGATVDFGRADVIYVNAGATHPVNRWLDGLADGGRLILPLTRLKRTDGNVRHGRVFLIERRGDDYFAKGLSKVAVYPCEGCGREAAAEVALTAAIDKDDEMKEEGWKKVTRLYRSDNTPADRCWLRATDWSLAYE